MVQLRGLLPRLSAYDEKFSKKNANSYASAKSAASSLLSTGLIVSYILTVRSLAMQSSFGFAFAMALCGLLFSFTKLILGVILSASDLTAPRSSGQQDVETGANERLSDSPEEEPQVIRGEIRAINLALLITDVFLSVCTGSLAGVGYTINTA